MYQWSIPISVAYTTTYRCCVDEDNNEDDQQDDNDCSYDVPLVELPDDVLERLQRRRKPQK